METRYQSVQGAQEFLVWLVGAVVEAPVQQAKLSVGTEAFGNEVHVVGVNAENLGNELQGPASVQLEDDQCPVYRAVSRKCRGL